MKINVLLLYLLCVPCAFAAEDGDSGEQTQPLTVEEILTRDPERGEYVEEEKCIQASRIRDVDVIDDRHIAFRMSRNEYYLIQFTNRCHDLRRGKPIHYERNNSRLCRNDVIRGMRDTGAGGLAPGMMCRIPGFQRVTKEQIVLLKDALKAKRREEREARRRKKS